MHSVLFFNMENFLFVMEKSYVRFRFFLKNFAY
jgi:hypothetical protein